MARYALIALLALALCAAPALALDLDVSGNSISITPVPGVNNSVFSNSWLTNMTYNGTTAVCVGQILYEIDNIGDAAISPSVLGPIKVSTPGDAGLFLVSPTSFQYSTTAAEGALFAAGFEITNVGYYADAGQTSVFALTMGCTIDYGDADYPPSGPCVCPGAETITFAATTNTASGKTSDVCGVGSNPGKLLDVGVCVTVKRQNESNTGGHDQYWPGSRPNLCVGHTLFTITNWGLSPIAQLSTNLKPLTISVSGSKSLGFFYPQGGDCCEYNYYSDDLVANASSVTIVDAGYYMSPGGTSTFAVTTWCKEMCPCSDLSFTVNY